MRRRAVHGKHAEIQHAGRSLKLWRRFLSRTFERNVESSQVSGGDFERTGYGSRGDRSEGNSKKCTLARDQNDGAATRSDGETLAGNVQRLQLDRLSTGISDAQGLRVFLAHHHFVELDGFGNNGNLGCNARIIGGDGGATGNHCRTSQQSGERKEVNRSRKKDEEAAWLRRLCPTHTANLLGAP